MQCQNTLTFHYLYILSYIQTYFRLISGFLASDPLFRSPPANQGTARVRCDCGSYIDCFLCVTDRKHSGAADEGRNSVKYRRNDHCGYSETNVLARHIAAL